MCRVPHHKHGGDVMKILLVGLVILWFNKASVKPPRLVAKEQIKSLFPLSLWKESYLSNLTICPYNNKKNNPAQTRPTIQPESLLMKAGSNYLRRPSTHRRVWWACLSWHPSLKTPSVCLSATHRSCHQYGPSEGNAERLQRFGVRGHSFCITLKNVSESDTKKPPTEILVLRVAFNELLLTSWHEIHHYITCLPAHTLIRFLAAPVPSIALHHLYMHCVCIRITLPAFALDA